LAWVFIWLYGLASLAENNILLYLLSESCTQFEVFPSTGCWNSWNRARIIPKKCL